MHRRRTRTIAIFLAVVAVISAASCGQQSTTDSTAGDAAAQPQAGLATAGTDAPMPAPLAPYPPREEAAERDGSLPSTARRNAAKGISRTASEPSTATLPTQAQQPGGMLIRTGHAVVEVDSVQVGIARVRRLAQESGALVANTTIHTGREQRRSASLELRVPSDRFDAVVNGLTPIGKVESVNISAQDVGEEFVDLTARLANARRLEARLIELLASRTGRLTDVLAVERELARVREEIERYEGRLRYLQSRVSVSSLTVVVHEPPPVVAAHPGENVIAEAFVEAWRRFVLLVAGFIASLGVLIPVAGVGVGAFVLWRRYGAQKPPAPEQA